MESRWFGASLLMRAVSKERGHEVVWDERVVVLQCLDEAEARQRCESIAHALEDTYQVQDGTHVEWMFAGIAEICQLGEQLQDGTEIISRFLRPSAARAILDHEVDEPGR